MKRGTLKFRTSLSSGQKKSLMNKSRILTQEQFRRYIRTKTQSDVKRRAIAESIDYNELPRNKRTVDAIYNRWSSVPEADIHDTARAFAEDYTHMTKVWANKSN